MSDKLKLEIWKASASAHKPTRLRLANTFDGIAVQAVDSSGVCITVLVVFQNDGKLYLRQACGGIGLQTDTDGRIMLDELEDTT